ncbi:DUF3850 domain-containing protein [Hafnia alvei]|uniref:DUF3850 domain-containing protein n=1 Tax=Hafnia alvei TaxID=569 RepID=UPI0010332CF3|nr:DUF3850 domain-containing protein [Hafnia alvei]TBM24384.1 DUF3850 domain-containing protein [Hafnia alvei]
MKTHLLKIKPDFFSAVVNGKKTAELRKNDRDFHEGQVLILREWIRGKYTGMTVTVRITHITPCKGFINDETNWVVLSFKKIINSLEHWYSADDKEWWIGHFDGVVE